MAKRSVMYVLVSGRGGGGVFKIFNRKKMIRLMQWKCIIVSQTKKKKFLCVMVCGDMC